MTSVWNRRTVLKYGVGGAVFLAAGGIGVSLQSTRMRPIPNGLKVLSAREFSILSAVADRVCPSHQGSPSASDVGVPQAVDGLVAGLHPADIAEFKQALAIVENALVNAVFMGQPRPFTQLSADDQDQVLTDWKTSRLAVRRKAYKSLNGLCSGAYFGTTAGETLSGYPGPPQYLVDIVASAQREETGQ